MEPRRVSRLSWVLPLVIAGCATTGPSKKPGSRTADEVAITPATVEGVKYAYYVIHYYSAPSHSRNEAFEAADGKAHADFEAAQAAAAKDDHRAAARLFFSCAVQYRATPEKALALDFAIRNATLCYQNAMYAFANAGRFESEGKALLQQAMKDDPRLAEAIKGMLAKAPSR